MKNDERIPVNCANCGKPLIEYWILNKEENKETKIRATCPYCNDKSYIKIIKGKFAIGVIGKQTDDDFADLIVTEIEQIEETKDGVYLFHVGAKK